MECGSFSTGSTGTTTVVLNNGSFVPTSIELEMGPRAGTNETLITRSSGWHDGTRHRTISIFGDTTLRGTRQNNTYTMTHYKNVAGTLTVAWQGTVTAFGTGQFDVNVQTADSNYSVYFKAFS